MPLTPYTNINNVLARSPPARLYQYTSSAGLIGIASSKSLWATHIHFLNDTKELEHAVDYARNCIENRCRGGSLATITDPREIDLLKQMSSMAGAVESAVYVASLTENRDQLSQWRGYCPPEGGFAIGFPAQHLSRIGQSQGFYLSPCIYDHHTQYHVLLEIVDHHIDLFRAALNSGEDEAKARDRVAIDFARQISRFGVILKHRSFQEEAEWRLVSPFLGIGDTRVSHRAGAGRVIPYTIFKLEDTSIALAELECVVGPTEDYRATSYGMQSLLYTEFPGATVWMGRSEAPYRTTR